MTTDLEIARSVTPRAISDVAAELGLEAADLRAYGTEVAKVSPEILDTPSKRSAPGR
jgi:formyltetrahydrofolate synthetase